MSRAGRLLARGGLISVILAGLVGLGIHAQTGGAAWATGAAAALRPVADPRPTQLGLNLYGLAPYNRSQVFTNLIAQSEWFSSRGDGWTPMAPGQLDRLGNVRFLQPGQTAPRPLVLPPAPFRRTVVRCTYQGNGSFDVGGIAQLPAASSNGLTFELAVTGAEDEGAWIELTATDPRDPVRALDCREADRPPGERFHPEFVSFLHGFRLIRFLDWQRTNDNADLAWAERTLPTSLSQAGPAGVSIEDMVDLANQTGIDPWFLMPYKADAAYIRAFARLVHDRLSPERTVYVELGNEVWNDMFDAAQQARREGEALRLGGGDPSRAQTIRYAQKVGAAMRIWTEVFGDRSDRLVRVAATQHVNPELAEIILDHGDTAQFVDALATAPYIWLELDRYPAGDLDRIFAALPGSVDSTIAFAERNRAVAERRGKRYIAYEGGQHLVTTDLKLARALQRDPRMAGVYEQYLGQWEKRIGGPLTLYASTTPIAEYGAWGLREYAGQPLEDAPKLQAVRRFLGERP